MRIPVRKLIVGAFLLVLLFLVFRSGLISLSTLLDDTQRTESRIAQMKGISMAAEKQLSNLGNYLDIKSDSNQGHLLSVILTASAIETQAEEASGLSTGMYENGAVIKVSGKDIVYPEGFPDTMHIMPEFLLGEYGNIVPLAQFEKNSNPEKESESEHIKDGTSGIPDETEAESAGMEDALAETDPVTFVYYTHLKDSYYYIEWQDELAQEEDEENYYDISRSMQTLEGVFDVRLLLLLKYDDFYYVVYASDGLPSGTTPDEYGVTQKLLAKAEENGITPDAGKLYNTFRMVHLDGEAYELYVQKIDGSQVIGDDTYLAYLLPYSSTKQLIDEQSTIVACVFFVIGIFLLAWLIATLFLVRNHSLSDSQKNEVSPGRLTRRVFSALGTGAVIIFAFYALFLSLFRLYGVSRQVDDALSAMKQRINDNKQLLQTTESSNVQFCEEYVSRIAQIMETDQKFATAEHLKSLNDMIGSQYIMLFDNNGYEIATSSRYTGLSLRSFPNTSASDFMRLLNGTEIIRHEPSFDKVSGQENVMIGASYVNPDRNRKEEDQYCAVLAAFPSDVIYGDSIESTGDIMSTLVTDESIAFSVDPDTGQIEDASDPSLVGANAQEMGLPGNALHKDFRDFFTFDGIPYYGESTEIDGRLYYYASTQMLMYRYILTYSATAAAGAFLLLMILALFLLFGYRKFHARWSDIGKVLSSGTDEVQTSSSRRKYSVDPSRRWVFRIERYGMHAPAHIAFLSSEILILALMVFMTVRLYSRDTDNISLLHFVLRGSWTKGLNLFAITHILFLFGEVFMAVTVVCLLLRMLSNALGTKGETICRLLINLSEYASVIFFVYFALLDLGFQPDTLLASLGLLSFAISLGARELITDIIAGLSIVFEGEFQVGDIIEVGGYRGRVLEIGVRTAKLEGRGGNIKIIRNQEIKDVINMTQKNSWCNLEISIPLSQPLSDVESLLSENLSHIGSSIQEIVSGPYYKGVSSIGNGNMTLSIIAECNEGDYYTVQRALNRSIQELFANQGIKII